MRNLEIIKFRKNPLSWPGIACPYCHSSNVVEVRRPIEKKIEQTDDRGYPVTQETYKEVSDCVCNECSGKYIVDYGENAYSVYESPLNLSNIGDIVCLAKFESEWHQNFEICATEDSRYAPSGYEKIYFIKHESDHFPMFVSKTQVDEFIKDSDKARQFVYSFWMTRYR